MNRLYFLPNREQTENAEEYIDAWESLAKPMMEMTGTTLHSFDPAVTLREKRDLRIVVLPVWFLQAFNDSYKQRLKKDEFPMQGKGEDNGTR